MADAYGEVSEQKAAYVTTTTNLEISWFPKRVMSVSDGVYCNRGAWLQVSALLPSHLLVSQYWLAVSTVINASTDIGIPYSCIDMREMSMWSVYVYKCGVRAVDVRRAPGLVPHRTKTQ